MMMKVNGSAGHEKSRRAVSGSCQYSDNQSLGHRHFSKVTLLVEEHWHFRLIILQNVHNCALREFWKKHLDSSIIESIIITVLPVYGIDHNLKSSEMISPTYFRERSWMFENIFKSNVFLVVIGQFVANISNSPSMFPENPS